MRLRDSPGLQDPRRGLYNPTWPLPDNPRVTPVPAPSGPPRGRRAAARVPAARGRPDGGQLLGGARDLRRGVLELTSRANVQVRGGGGFPPPRGGGGGAVRVKDPAGFAAADRGGGVAAVGVARAVVRNIIASALSGCRTDAFRGLISGAGRDDLRAHPELADLRPGGSCSRSTSGSGDVAGLGADVVLMSRGEHFAVLAGTTDLLLRLPPAEAIHEAVKVAQNFLRRLRGRVARSTTCPATSSLARRRNCPSHGPAATSAISVRRPGRWSPGPPDRGAGDGAGRGRMAADHPVAHPPRPEGHAPARGADHRPGEPVAPRHRLHRSPGATSPSDVQADARPIGAPVHWSGCARKCGRPRARSWT